MTTDSDELFSVRDKCALVTGGSRGIGAMIAEGLVRAGARVIIASRKPADVEATALRLRRFGECLGEVADLLHGQGVRALAGRVERQFDRLHVLVNNAGATWGAPLEAFPEEGWDKVFDTNVRGVFYLTVSLLGRLRAAASEHDPARVINIGSIDGLRVPDAEWQNYPYSASKAALHMLTRHLASRLAGERITVNAIAPGFFPSKMTAFLLDDEPRHREVVDTVPLGRVGEPDDIDGVVRFLASRAGAYLTGSLITVDGGASLSPGHTRPLDSLGSNRDPSQSVDQVS